jgi:hypothetical protein
MPFGAVHHTLANRRSAVRCGSVHSISVAEAIWTLWLALLATLVLHPVAVPVWRLAVVAWSRQGWEVGSPGASAGAMALRRPGPRAWQWTVGAEGERRTADDLRPLLRRGYCLLHDRALPHTKANVDLLVIGPTGVFNVDTKYLAGEVTCQRGVVCVSGLPYKLGMVVGESRRVERTLGVPCRSVICIQRASIRARGYVVTLEGCRVFVGDAEAVLRHIRRARPAMSRGRAAVLAKAAARLLPSAE